MTTQHLIKILEIYLFLKRNDENDSSNNNILTK